MPILKEEKETIKRLAKEYGARRMWLFGSCLDEDAEPNDIDLAVEGVAPEKFYRFYGRLFKELPRPVDLVDMADDLPIVSIVRDTGVLIYGKPRTKSNKPRVAGKIAHR
jgi:predicted nucleotidyltransferase